MNDFPLPTNSLIQFIDEQITISNGDTLSSQNKIFMDEEKTFDLTEWFADPDKSVDSKEKLDYEIYIEDNDGNQIKVDELYTDTISGWIKHDKTNKTLSLLPKSKDIGKHYISLNAIDNAGEKASFTIPIKIFWKNRKPTIDTNNINERIKSINSDIK